MHIILKTRAVILYLKAPCLYDIYACVVHNIPNYSKPDLTLCFSDGNNVCNFSTRLMCAAAISVSSSPNTSIIVSTASIATHNSDSRLQTSRRNLPIFWQKKKKEQNEGEYCTNTKRQNDQFLTKIQSTCGFKF